MAFCSIATLAITNSLTVGSLRLHEITDAIINSSGKIYTYILDPFKMSVFKGFNALMKEIIGTHI